MAARLKRATLVPVLSAAERADWLWLIDLLSTEHATASADAPEALRAAADVAEADAPPLPREAATPCEPSPHLCSLPAACLRRVLRLLSARALGDASATCRRVRDVAYSSARADGEGLPGWATWRPGVPEGAATLVIDALADSIDSRLLRTIGARRVASVALGPRAVDLSDAQLGSLLRSAGAGLRRLSLDECDCLTDAAAPLLGGLPALHTLSLAGCEGLSARGIADAVSGLASSLTALDLSYLSDADAALQLLLRPPPVAAPAAATPAEGSLRGLRSLSLSCSSTSDATIASLGALRPPLAALNLSSCQQLSDDAIATLLRSLPALTSCDLSYLPVSDGGALAALEGCSDLAIVNLEGCPLVSEPGIAGLAASVRSLQYANVSGCDVDPARGDFTPRDALHAPADGADAADGVDADASKGEPPLLTPRSTPQYLIAPRGAASSRLLVCLPGPPAPSAAPPAQASPM